MSYEVAYARAYTEASKSATLAEAMEGYESAKIEYIEAQQELDKALAKRNAWQERKLQFGCSRG